MVKYGQDIGSEMNSYLEDFLKDKTKMHLYTLPRLSFREIHNLKRIKSSATLEKRIRALI